MHEQAVRRRSSDVGRRRRPREAAGRGGPRHRGGRDPQPSDERARRRRWRRSAKHLALRPGRLCCRDRPLRRNGAGSAGADRGGRAQWPTERCPGRPDDRPARWAPTTWCGAPWRAPRSEPGWAAAVRGGAVVGGGRLAIADHNQDPDGAFHAEKVDLADITDRRATPRRAVGRRRIRGVSFVDARPSSRATTSSACSCAAAKGAWAPRRSLSGTRRCVRGQPSLPGRSARRCVNTVRCPIPPR